ncbi:MAG: M23 family metallopeptidase [Deltaproteobacteria bacterium]|nr:MAG: M23 family metallopeptidase [Deltaproteobacteria bacterium]
MASASKSERDPQTMRTGELVELFFHQDSRRLEKVRLHDKNDRVLTMGRAAWGWVIGVYTKPSVVVSAFAQGTIRDSLYQSAQDEGVPFELAMALADIFAWDIDFFVDLRPDDRYAFLYEQIYQNGRTVGNGRIIAAHFSNAGVHHRAYYYEVSGKGSDYYDAKGNSLRRQFLKSPLRYSRISSGFSKRRLHPILKIYRPHLGIDYSAPTNTPVVAVGDGRVISIGWKNGYGRFIAIRHSNRYTTTYGHLSRYTRGLKMGHSVKQGQVIGFVGASGLATGPHLDFRMKRDGRFVNPLKVRLPAAQPLPRTHLADFQQLVSSLEDKLGRALARDQWGESDPLASLDVAHD